VTNKTRHVLSILNHRAEHYEKKACNLNGTEFNRKTPQRFVTSNSFSLHQVFDIQIASLTHINKLT